MSNLTNLDGNKSDSDEKNTNTTAGDNKKGDTNSEGSEEEVHQGLLSRARDFVTQTVGDVAAKVGLTHHDEEKKSATSEPVTTTKPPQKDSAVTEKSSSSSPSTERFSKEDKSKEEERTESHEGLMTRAMDKVLEVKDAVVDKIKSMAHLNNNNDSKEEGQSLTQQEETVPENHRPIHLGDFMNLPAETTQDTTKSSSASKKLGEETQEEQKPPKLDSENFPSLSSNLSENASSSSTTSTSSSDPRTSSACPTTSGGRLNGNTNPSGVKEGKGVSYAEAAKHEEIASA